MSAALADLVSGPGKSSPVAPSEESIVRTLPRRTLVVMTCASFLFSSGAARAAEVPAWRDPNPLPADTMHYDGGEIGRKGGRFVLAATSPPRTFNPMMSNESSSNDVNNLMWTSLVDYDYVSGGMMPGLARSWKRAADSVTYTLRLRRGARFSDGHPITSEDVVFSATVGLDSTLHPVVRDVLMVDGRPFVFTAPDSYTVVVSTPRPFAMTLLSLASLRILPRHRLEPVYRAGGFASAYNVGSPPESLVTSGPWRLATYTANEKVVLERNPWWYRVDARGVRLPYLDQIAFLIVPDQNTAALKFQAGEVDAVDNVKVEDYRGYEDRARAGGYTLYTVGPSLTTNFFWFNLNTVKEPGKSKPVGAPVVDPVKYAWFRNPVFRRAVSKAIDRDAIVRGPYFGLAVKNWATSTPANKLWSSPSFKGDDYDPAGAKKLLASIGFIDRNHDGVVEDPQGNPVSFTIKTNADNETRKTMVNMIRDDLARVGIRVTSAPTPFNALAANLRQDFDYDAILLGLGSPIPPDPALSANVFRSSGLTHFWNVKQTHAETREEARLDSLADVLSGSFDDAARHRAYAEITRILSDQNYFIWLPTQIIKLPVRSRFGNAAPQAVPHRILWNHERLYVKPSGRKT